MASVFPVQVPVNRGSFLRKKTVIFDILKECSHWKERMHHISILPEISIHTGTQRDKTDSRNDAWK